MTIRAAYDFVRFAVRDPELKPHLADNTLRYDDALVVAENFRQRCHYDHDFDFEEGDLRFSCRCWFAHIEEHLRGRTAAGVREDHRRLPTIVGNSHAGSLLEAAFFEAAGGPYAWDGSVFSLGPRPYVDDERSPTAFHPKITRWLQNEVVFSAISRSVHDYLVLRQHSEPFDFALPTRPDLGVQEGVAVIPYEMMKHRCERALDIDLKIISLARATSSKMFFHTISPPPLEDDALVLSKAPFPKREGAPDAVSPAPLRLKVYLVCVDIMRDWCKGLGVPVIDPPEETLTERGYLKSQFCADATHGNVAYCRLMLDKMRGFL